MKFHVCFKYFAKESMRYDADAKNRKRQNIRGKKD